MSHVNKGVAGLRIAHVDATTLERVHIASLRNEGKDDANPSFCHGVEPRYGGKDVFGVVIENSMDTTYEESSEGLLVDMAGLISVHGGDVEGVRDISTRRLQSSNNVLPPKATEVVHEVVRGTPPRINTIHV